MTKTEKKVRGKNGGKRPGAGRKPSFETPELLSKAIKEYMDSISVIQKKGRYKGSLFWREMPTKNGIAIYLDISIDTLENYERKSDYSEPIKKAYTLIEQAWTQSLNRQYPTGAIFYLKNAFKQRWRDRHELGSDGTMPVPNVVIYGSDDLLKEVMDKRAKQKKSK